MRYSVRDALLAAVPIMGITVAMALAGCERPLGPRSDLSVTVDSVGPPEALLAPAGGIVMQCPVYLTAANSSSSQLDWITSVMHYYPGGDTTVHSDSALFMPGSVAAIWGGAYIRPGQRRSATWLAAAPAPYHGVMNFRFQNDSSRTGFGVTSVSFGCGVEGVRARPSSGSPTITTFAIYGPDTITAPDFLRLNLVVADSNGLWTAVFHDISEPCSWDLRDWWADLPKTFSSTDGSLAMWFQLGCPSGPRTVTVTVRDAFLHEAVDTVTAYVR